MIVIFKMFWIGEWAVWQHVPLISAHGRQRQEDLYDFKASLINMAILDPPE